VDAGGDDHALLLARNEELELRTSQRHKFTLTLLAKFAEHYVTSSTRSTRRSFLACLRAHVGKDASAVAYVKVFEQVNEL